jgi:hypothetical protein
LPRLLAFVFYQIILLNIYLNISLILIWNKYIVYIDQRTEVQIHPDILLRWLKKQVALYDKIHIEDMGASFKDGMAICAIIHRYRPDLIDFYNLNMEDVVKNNQLAFDTLEKELGILPVSIYIFIFLSQYI